MKFAGALCADFNQGISAMASSFRISSLVPSGLVVESVIESEDMIKVTARSCASEAMCPSCGSISRQVHSRYFRQVSDLPCTGRRVALSLIARRFFCRAENCRRRIFAGRFDDAVLAGHARRTARLECIVHHLGLALGGRPAASFARRLMLPVSNDTCCVSSDAKPARGRASRHSRDR
jgi:transposase